MAHNSILIIIGLIFSTQLICGFESKLQEDQEKCKESCPKIRDPVCAYNGRIFVEYSNKCVFEAAQCKARNEEAPALVIRPLRFCRRGTISVPDPRVTQLVPDESMSVKAERCPEVCPAVYDPVCAQLGDYVLRYSNPCRLSIAQCNARKNGTPVPVRLETRVCPD